jgi:hypothetical protein
MLSDAFHLALAEVIMPSVAMLSVVAPRKI